MQHKNPAWIPYLILVVLALIWGSSFILIKKCLVDYSSAEVALGRMVAAGTFFLPFAITRLHKPRRQDWKYFVVLFIVGSAVPGILFTTAQQHVSSAVAGALNALTPLFTLLISLWLFKRKQNNAKFLGVFVGLIGALILVFTKNNTGFVASQNPHYVYGLLVVLATFCYGINVNILEEKFKHLDAITLSAMPFSMLGLLAAPVLFFLTDFAQHIDIDPTHINLMASTKANSFYLMVLLGMVNTGIATILFNKLLKMTSGVVASSVTYLMPIVSLFWGWIDGEWLGLPHIVGLMTILVGVYLVKKK